MTVTELFNIPKIATIATTTATVALGIKTRQEKEIMGCPFRKMEGITYNSKEQEQEPQQQEQQQERIGIYTATRNYRQSRSVSSSKASMTSASNEEEEKQEQQQPLPPRHRLHHSGHNRWALGMIIFFVFVFSSSTSVLCVPLNRPELTDSSASSSSSSSSAASPYTVQSKGQLFLPSLLNSPNDNNPAEENPNPQIQENEDESTRSEWETVIDPRLYVLTEWNSNPMLQQQRSRRNAGPSLSIVNPLDVLRQRLLLEIARRRMRQSHHQIIANAEILKNIGRRR